MGNPLFQNQPQNNGNPVLNMVNSLRSQGTSGAVFNQLYQNNPVAPNGVSFRDLYDKVRNMTPEEAFRQNGLDFNNFRNLKW